MKPPSSSPLGLSRRSRLGLCGLPILAVAVWIATGWQAGPEPVSADELWEAERRWVAAPLRVAYSPSNGSVVRPGEPLLKISWVGATPPDSHTFVIDSRGRIGDAWHTDADAGGERDLGPAAIQGLQKLDGLLSRLPPSKLAAVQPLCIIVAIPQGRIWQIRLYPKHQLPEELNAIVRELELRNSIDHQIVDHL